MSQQPTETISITRIESGKGVDTADKVTVEEPWRCSLFSKPKTVQ